MEKAISDEDSLKQLLLVKLARASQGGGNSGGTAGELPATKELEVEIEGMTETRIAQLAEGNGYALYIFDIFTFDSEANTLSMNYDNKYNVEIIKLPSNYNADQLSLEAKEQLSKTGKVQEVQGDVIQRFMPDTSVFLDATGDKLTQQYIVKEIDGQGYIFKLNIPHGEPTEGFVPLAYASLNSIVAK
ncbi:hypothetical protein D3C77_551650 [compost metagenome]